MGTFSGKKLTGRGLFQKKIDEAETFYEKKIDGVETFPEKNIDKRGLFWTEKKTLSPVPLSIVFAPTLKSFLQLITKPSVYL